MICNKAVDYFYSHSSRLGTIDNIYYTCIYFIEQFKLHLIQESLIVIFKSSQVCTGYYTFSVAYCVY